MISLLFADPLVHLPSLYVLYLSLHHRGLSFLSLSSTGCNDGASGPASPPHLSEAEGARRGAAVRGSPLTKKSMIEGVPRRWGLGGGGGGLGGLGPVRPPQFLAALLLLSEFSMPCKPPGRRAQEQSRTSSGCERGRVVRREGGGAKSLPSPPQKPHRTRGQTITCPRMSPSDTFHKCLRWGVEVASCSAVLRQMLSFSYSCLFTG